MNTSVMPFPFSSCAHACAMALAVLSTSSWAASRLQTLNTHQDEVLVSASRIDMRDMDAPYASEVHTRQDIQNSGAHSLTDYLSQQSSLQVLPSSGNRYTPQISMRGYGNDGFQNLIISVNGRRLNNIDQVPQLIGSISLDDIERIEITKGSGAVLFGDGAMAGTIQIYTRARDSASLEAYAGNYGSRGAIASTGMVRDKFELSATADHSYEGGFSDKDPDGHKDQSEANTWRFSAALKPMQGLRLDAEVGASNIDTRYPNALTLAQFESHPGMNNGTNYTQQKLANQHWRLGAEYQLTPQWKLSASHLQEDRENNNISWNIRAHSRYSTNELALQFQNDRFVINAGLQHLDGKRTSADNSTSKNNQGMFFQGQYMQEALTLSAGVRYEQVQYRYIPLSGTTLESKDQLHSLELGANHRISPQLALFANYSDAFAAPDIDRFFNWGGTFNQFIQPAKARTLTVGANHQTGSNRLKLSVFYAKLHNEIYYYKTGPSTGANTNIDRSHKYGLELQNHTQFTPRLSGHVNYTWTQAIIDRENEGARAFNSKQLPGVSRHSLVLGLDVRVTAQGTLNLSHTWRSTAWAAEDFANNFSQKQRAFQSTSLHYQHQIAKHTALYVSVNNLFAHKNGVWIRDNSIYPVNFERTWKLGARWKF